MYQALYRKYRPKTFDDVVGQDVIVKTLKNSIKNNIVSHAYLFAGPRGTGKTSIAKIFAKILNCHDLQDLKPCNKCISCEQANNNQNIDIIEIDAASNNGVDEIREIRKKITLVPTNSKYKIYIIDEVHMLTDQAFNALLKTLEEPPSHIIFIFATTEPHKIPRTILSRCQRFDFKKVSDNKIVERLKYIAEQENITITDEALKEIAKLSDGGMRDSISLLDQTLAYSDNEITINDIHDINGTLLPEEIDSFILKMLKKDLVGLLSSLEEYDNSGKNIVKIVQELISRLKDTLIAINAPTLVNNEPFFDEVRNLKCNNAIYTHIKSLSSLMSEMKNVNDSKLLLEIELIKNINSSNFLDNENSDATVEKSEKTLNNKVKDQKEKVENEITTKEEIDKKEPKKEIIYDKVKLEELKKIRINNALYKFSQKEREKIKKQIEKLDDYLNDEKFGKIVSLIKDGELKAVSDNYLMFMYNTELLAESFNQQLLIIEELFNKCFNNPYHVIAIDLNDWDFIKNDYNKNKDKYVLKDENISINEIFEAEDKVVQTSDKNEIDEMFNDIIEYE